MKNKMDMRKLLRIVIFIMGLAMVSYPLVSSIIERQYQKNAVSTYKKMVEEAEQENVEVSLEDAHAYNSMLYQTNGIVLGTTNSGILSEDNYNSLLNVTGTGVMGSIDIPKINVSLPIYHGTSDEVLSVGVGHVKDSSLPIGGINTRTVLTGHRGLPNSKLFTRLDEMEVGDLFFIEVLGEMLAYQVIEIEVIEPEDLESLSVVPEKDLATLLTCHPYGINSHRLIVTGERVEYTKSEHMAIENEMMSFRELFFASLPFIFAGVGIVSIVKNKKSKKEVDINEVESKTH